MKQDLPLIIFVLVVVVISLSYWWYRQRTIKTPSEGPESEEEENISPPKV